MNAVDAADAGLFLLGIWLGGMAGVFFMVFLRAATKEPKREPSTIQIQIDDDWGEERTTGLERLPLSGFEPKTRADAGRLGRAETIHGVRPRQPETVRRVKP